MHVWRFWIIMHSGQILQYDTEPVLGVFLSDLLMERVRVKYCMRTNSRLPSHTPVPP